MPLYIPIWPNSTGSAFWGATDYGHNTTCSSTWLSLRNRTPGIISEYSNEDYLHNYLGIYIWFDESNTYSIDLKVHDLHSARESEFVQLLKLLRKYKRRVIRKNFPLDQFVRNPQHFDIYPALIKLASALDITESIEYVGVNGTHHTPIAERLAVVAERINKMQKQLKGTQ